MTPMLLLCIFNLEVLYKLLSLKKPRLPILLWKHLHPYAMTLSENMWKQKGVWFSVLVSWVVHLAVELCFNTGHNHVMSVSLKCLSVLSAGWFPRIARSCLSAGTRHVTLLKCLLQYLEAVMCRTDTRVYLNTHSAAALWCDSAFLTRRHPRRWMPA